MRKSFVFGTRLASLLFKMNAARATLGFFLVLCTYAERAATAAPLSDQATKILQIIPAHLNGDVQVQRIDFNHYQFQDSQNQIFIRITRRRDTGEIVGYRRSTTAEFLPEKTQAFAADGLDEANGGEPALKFRELDANELATDRFIWATNRGTLINTRSSVSQVLGVLLVIGQNHQGSAPYLQFLQILEKEGLDTTADQRKAIYEFFKKHQRPAKEKAANKQLADSAEAKIQCADPREIPDSSILTIERAFQKAADS